MQRMTRQRAAVLDLLGDTPDFRSAQQLHEDLLTRGESIGLATVYRNLTVLAEQGRVDVMRIGEENLFRKCEQTHHHHHLVCRECGRTVELSGENIERWAAGLGAETGFTEIDHTLELVGLCGNCSEKDA
ncbi:MAG: Fur family transcriptional regulator [bacterium]|nr:Fur family transcriptional regulator [bacterium]